MKSKQPTLNEAQISSNPRPLINNRQSQMVVTTVPEDEKSAHKTEKHDSSSPTCSSSSSSSLSFNGWKKADEETERTGYEEKGERKFFQDSVLQKGHSKMNENSLSEFTVCRSKEDDKNSFTEHKYSARFLVAFLGLAIAVVNCYAQATFCIAIVEMVLPSDYNIKSESSQLAGAETNPKAGQNSPLSIATSKPTNKPTINDRSVAVEPLLMLTMVNRASEGSGLVDDADQSCPIEFKYRDYYDSWRFPATGGGSLGVNVSSTEIGQLSSESVDVSNRFDWDASRQGLLLGAFAVGTAPLQILGGRLAEIYGAKWVLLVGCIGTAITNLTIPLLAHYSFALLMLNRIVMGISQAGMEPGLMCLMANWLTPTEIGFFISMLLFAICTGFFLGSLGSSFLLTLGYSWPITYYVAGGANMAIGILWFFIASSKPRDSNFLSSKEVNYIEREQQLARQKEYLNSGQKQDSQANSQWKRNISNELDSKNTTIGGLASKQTLYRNTAENLIEEETSDACHAPWLNILTSKAVWAFIICKFSIRWSADVISIELPTYLANVLHLSIKLNGIINGVSNALFAIVAFLTGYLVNEITKSKWMLEETSTVIGTSSGEEREEQIVRKRGMRISKTNLRKVVQSIASFGSALAVFMMTQYDCNILFSMSMLFVLSCTLVMGTGGELQIPYDMTSRYPGTLHGMACTLSVSGWLAPPLIGLILGEHPSSRYRWSLVWYMTAIINLIGGLAFVLLADANPCDFDRKKRSAKLSSSRSSVAANPPTLKGWSQRRSYEKTTRTKSKVGKQPVNDNKPDLMTAGVENSQLSFNHQEQAHIFEDQRGILAQQVANCRLNKSAKQTGWSYLVQQQELAEQCRKKQLSTGKDSNELFLHTHDDKFISTASRYQTQAPNTKGKRISSPNSNTITNATIHNSLAANSLLQQQQVGKKLGMHNYYDTQEMEEEEEEEELGKGWRKKQNIVRRLWTRFLIRGRRGKFSVVVPSDSEGNFLKAHKEVQHREAMKGHSGSKVNALSNVQQFEHPVYQSPEPEKQTYTGFTTIGLLEDEKFEKNLRKDTTADLASTLNSPSFSRGNCNEEAKQGASIVALKKQQQVLSSTSHQTEASPIPTVVVLLDINKSKSNKFSSFPISTANLKSRTVQEQQQQQQQQQVSLPAKRGVTKTITHL